MPSPYSQIVRRLPRRTESHLSLSFCLKSGDGSSSLWSNVSKVKSLKDGSLKEFSICICLCHCLCLCICLCHCIFLVRSCPLITLIKCLKGDKSLGHSVVVFLKRCLSEWVSEWVSDKVTYWAVGWTAKKHIHTTGGWKQPYIAQLCSLTVTFDNLQTLSLHWHFTTVLGHTTPF